MTDPELIRRAEAAGITTSYENWQRQRVDVAPATLEAILAALAQSSPAPGRPPAPAAPACPAATESGAAAAGNAPVPSERSWGFTVQLYSVRSKESWGHGDLRDLAELAAWSARDHGAGFVLVNPLHAAEPVPPVSPSPYLPMTRRYASPLYLRVEDIPEYARLAAAQRDQIQRLAQPLRARNTSAGLIDRDAVWTAKRAALELIYQTQTQTQTPLTPPRQAAFDAYREREGPELELLGRAGVPWPSSTDPTGGPGPPRCGTGTRAWRTPPWHAPPEPGRRVPRLAAMAGGRAAGRRPAGRTGRRDAPWDHP